MQTEIGGSVAPGFEPVLAAFEAAFQGGSEMGAALAVRHHGIQVVDLWAGVADPRTAAPWREDTLSVIFSCTKGLMALLVARLVQDGVLHYHLPLAHVWPEFAAHGKESITLAQVLAHRAGLSAPAQRVTLEQVLDWDEMVGVLEREEPLWTPGSGHAYHALTYGWLVGEVIRRVTGMSVGAAFARVISDPLKAEAWIGIPPHLEPRVAHLRSTPAMSPPGVSSEIDWNERALTLGGAFPVDLVSETGGFNDSRVHQAEIPAGGGIATARALATIWSAAIVETDGVRLLDDATITEAVRVQSDGPTVFSAAQPWGRWGMGWELDSDALRYVTPSGFGHSGAGGQLAFADPDASVGFALLTNLLEGENDTRARGVVDALRNVV